MIRLSWLVHSKYFNLVLFMCIEGAAKGFKTTSPSSKHVLISGNYIKHGYKYPLQTTPQQPASIVSWSHCWKYYTSLTSKAPKPLAKWVTHDTLFIISYSTLVLSFPTWTTVELLIILNFYESEPRHCNYNVNDL